MAIERIMFVVNCLNIGGAEVQVARLADGMIRRGKKVAVVSLRGEGPLSKQIADSGAELYSLKMSAGIPSPMGVWRLRKAIKSFRPDAVHSHIVHANLLSRVTRIIAKMPVLVTTAHSVNEGHRILELGYRYTDRFADLTTNVSKAAVDRYVKIGAAPVDRIQFVANGLDIGKFSSDPADRGAIRAELGIADDQFLWLAVGRLQEAKDYPNMIRAFGKTLKNPVAANSSLMIAGEGLLEGELKAFTESVGLKDRIRFLGRRNDIPALMNAADAYLMSSAWEGMPMVLQEALACRLPVVSTDVGGNAEVAPDGLCSFLCESKNDDALCAAMLKMLSLPAATRNAMGAAGREHVVARYNIERVLDQWLAIYEKYAQLRLVKNAS